MERITQEQFEELVYMMGVHKRKIMDRLAFNSDDDIRSVKEIDFKQVRQEILEMKQVLRG